MTPALLGQQVTTIVVRDARDMFYPGNVRNTEGGKIVHLFRIVSKESKRLAVDKMLQESRRIAKIALL